jgi:hypothetical protein
LSPALNFETRLYGTVRAAFFAKYCNGLQGSSARASSDNPTYLTQRERIRDGMRKAGLPEG